MKRTLTLLLAVAATTTAAPTQRMNGRQQIQDLLEWATMEIVSDGYIRVNPMRAGSLAHGASTYITVRLVAGQDYQIVGVCDDECTDLDLQLFSPGQHLLDSDHAADDLPVLFATARVTGTHVIRVWMNGCETALCDFGVATFRRVS